MHFIFLFNKILGKYFIWLAMKSYISPKYSMTNRSIWRNSPILMTFLPLVFITILIVLLFSVSVIDSNTRSKKTSFTYHHGPFVFFVVAISSKITIVSKIFLSFYLHPKFKLMISLICAWLTMNSDKKTKSPVEWTKLLRCIINHALC